MNKMISQTLVILSLLGVVASTSVAAAQYDPQVYQIQSQLQKLGYTPGSLDGKLGTKTISAIKRFQYDNGLPETGKIDNQLKAKIQMHFSQVQEIDNGQPTNKVTTRETRISPQQKAGFMESLLSGIATLLTSIIFIIGALIYYSIVALYYGIVTFFKFPIQSIIVLIASLLGIVWLLCRFDIGGSYGDYKEYHSTINLPNVSYKPESFIEMAKKYSTLEDLDAHSSLPNSLQRRPLPSIFDTMPKKPNNSFSTPYDVKPIWEKSKRPWEK